MYLRVRVEEMRGGKERMEEDGKEGEDGARES